MTSHNGDTGELGRAPGRPVIVVHLADDNHPELTTCSPMLMPNVPEEAFQGVPRVLCEACRLLALDPGQRRTP
jgi:hypothetical protein